ncbi:hypothetical protein FXO38_16172 [Capsicum annuum]|nr:hypothetical protein FXO38_16172 [Capsicum annuum]
MAFEHHPHRIPTTTKHRLPFPHVNSLLHHLSSLAPRGTQSSQLHHSKPSSSRCPAPTDPSSPPIATPAPARQRYSTLQPPPRTSPSDDWPSPAQIRPPPSIVEKHQR